jgi:hypothetical protein
MITLLKYSISLIIWAVVAGAFLIAKSPQLFAFWALLGTAILVGWFFKMFWKWFVGIFFPTIELRAYIIGVLILLIGALLFFEYSIVPKWNRWGATKDELKKSTRWMIFCRRRKRFVYGRLQSTRCQGSLSAGAEIDHGGDT